MLFEQVPLRGGLGAGSTSTTRVYPHVLNRGPLGVRSTLDWRAARPRSAVPRRKSTAPTPRSQSPPDYTDQRFLDDAERHKYKLGRPSGYDMSRKPGNLGPTLNDSWPPPPLGFEDIGLPSHKTHRIHSVSYNKPARAMVAVAQPLEFATEVDQRVFAREVGQSHYREIALPSALASVTHALVCAEGPFVVANMMEWSTAERSSANYLGLFRVKLPGGSFEKLPDPVNPVTAPETVSVVALLAVSADARELHLVVTVPIFVRVPPEHGYAMGFFLASYESDSGRIHIIDEVRGMSA